MRNTIYVIIVLRSRLVDKLHFNSRYSQLNLLLIRILEQRGGGGVGSGGDNNRVIVDNTIQYDM